MIYKKILKKAIWLIYLNFHLVFAQTKTEKWTDHHFGAEVGYAYRASNEFSFGLNYIHSSNWSKKTGCLFAISYNGEVITKKTNPIIGHKINCDVSFWFSKMHFEPSLGYSFEHLEGLKLNSNFKIGFFLTNVFGVYYQYSLPMNYINNSFLNQNSIGIAFKLNFISIDLGYNVYGNNKKKKKRLN